MLIAGFRRHTGIELSEVYRVLSILNNFYNNMVEVLFKSEELLIAANSESKVIYGNTRRNSAVKYLNNLTPKNSEEAIGIIILILSSKYVVAKKISVTTKTEVTVKPSVVKTAEDALRIASKFNLEEEVQHELDNTIRSS